MVQPKYSKRIRTGNRMRVETSLAAPVTLRVHQSGQIFGQAIDTTWTATLPAN